MSIFQGVAISLTSTVFVFKISKLNKNFNFWHLTFYITVKSIRYKPKLSLSSNKQRFSHLLTITLAIWHDCADWMSDFRATYTILWSFLCEMPLLLLPWGHFRCCAIFRMPAKTIENDRDVPRFQLAAIPEKMKIKPIEITINNFGKV